MALSLNFNEDTLQKNFPSLYDLYSRLYQGMKDANKADMAIDFPHVKDEEGNDVLDANGDPLIDAEQVKDMMASASDIQMKNAAYMLANSITTSLGNNTDSEGNFVGAGAVARSGDSMTGNLSALYGFSAGTGNHEIFKVSKEQNGDDVRYYAYFPEEVDIDKNLNLTGDLKLSNSSGIYFGTNKLVYLDGSGNLNLGSDKVVITGSLELSDGATLSLGDYEFLNDSIYLGDNKFYHSGNANLSTVDWDMNDAYVYGDLDVDGVAEFRSGVYAYNGFTLGITKTITPEEGDPYEEFCSFLVSDATNERMQLNVDLNMTNGSSIQFNGQSIVAVRTTDNGIVSFSAPDMVMNLGDSYNDTKTKYISLQTEIRDYTHLNQIISQYGDGKFMNSLQAGSSLGGDTVLQTYYLSADDQGVEFKHGVRLGVNSRSPRLYGGTDRELFMSLVYGYMNDDTQEFATFGNKWYLAETTSPFRNLSLSNSATLHLDTDAEFIAFDKNVEAEGFCIQSELYKTRLSENTLFFNDNVFLEGINGGIRYSGNAQFDNNLSSETFSSGFAGSGWAIQTDEQFGGIGATFDTLTIRKKFKTYELEVQKLSVTNGSLWVSDSCSGDTVVEVA